MLLIVLTWKLKHGNANSENVVTSNLSRMDFLGKIVKIEFRNKPYELFFQ